MNELNEEQRAAVESPAKKIIVTAAAGSGKTRTLIERVRWLLSEDHVQASSMVLISYTNHAAEVMATRLLEMGITVGFCGTLHSYMMLLLRRHGAIIGLPAAIAVLDDKQREAMLEVCITELRVKASVKMVDAHIDGTKKFEAKPASEIALVLSQYNRRCLENGMLDFDGILKYGLALLKTKLSDMEIDALLCDEIQDASSLDHQIYEAVMASYKFCCGDIRQSIFAFRGGDPAEMQRLVNGANGYSSLELASNYRCDAAIVRLANKLCGGHMESMTGEEGGVSIAEYPDPQAQFQAIAATIKLQQRMTAFEDCAVLVRTNGLVQLVAETLEAQGVPVMKRVMDDAPGDWARTRLLINLLVNPENDLLAYWWIKEMYGRLRADMVKMEALTAHMSINRNNLHVSPPPVDAVDSIPDVLVRAGLSIESVARVKLAIELLPPGATLSDLSAKLGAEELWRKDDGQGVRCMTYHAAKGSEFDAVYLPCLNEGVMPMKRDDPEEARRLLYVGITRARHRLELMCGKTIFEWDFVKKKNKLIPAEPSRFLRELQA